MLGHSKLEFILKYYTYITGHMADIARMVIDKKLILDCFIIFRKFIMHKIPCFLFRFLKFLREGVEFI